MALNVDLQIPESFVPGIPGLVVQSLDWADGISDLFELTLEFSSTEPALSMAALVGRQAEVSLPDEPFLSSIRGIVRRARQLTSEPTGISRYRATIVPQLWLATRRSNHRVFQDVTAPEVVAEVIARYGGLIPAPEFRLASSGTRHEYIAQYGETDHHLLLRLLGDEGMASFFDGSVGTGAWTIVGDTSVFRRALPRPIPFVEASGLERSPGIPHAQGAESTSRMTTGSVNLRDFDADNPRFLLEASANSTAFANEAELEDSEFAVGDFRDGSAGGDLARRRLAALAAKRTQLRFETSFAVSAGTTWSLTGHPRADLDQAWLVLRSRLTMRSESGRVVSRRVLDCVDARTPFLPPRRAKPRIAGAQTARVVASAGSAGKEIDVDAMGRVLVEFRWDRRDLGEGSSRRVRVAQAWAGAGYGLVTLPRVGDEVVVTYLDGDPDQPLVVGRVHNAIDRTPLDLPAQDTVSVWRSRSSPGGAGFNQISMDDAAGAERLDVRAQRDFRLDVGNDAELNVLGNTNTRISGNSGTNVQGGAAVGTGGPVNLDAPSVTINTATLSATATTMHFSAGDRLDESANHRIAAGGIYLQGSSVVQAVGPHFHVFCDDIVVKGANFTIEASGGITITSGGDIAMTAAGVVDIKGATIKLNS
jgi:type VI secretion system secreted protein VgrG